ncbi:hypothetical protein I540_4920 [Mycobacteroides abscessus subsp. bolletii 1513]|uniref:Uncharacterized protein n=1 Tax=Mycobacteroides abscessus subsp. bolletii 1513 TaxID=1299321 RepID=X8DE47_9MYCO|nr:hypothetical protein I540_4920 [Mycobacteroides abscessus subsp. bolletii 1513]
MGAGVRPVSGNRCPKLTQSTDGIAHQSSPEGAEEFVLQKVG